MPGYSRITAYQFAHLGGFSNPRLLRVPRARGWAYFIREA